jgi:hypothetical protein
MFTEGSVLDVVIGSVALVAAIYSMASWRYDREIYLIWYIESFFFLLFYGMGVVAEKRDAHLTDVCGAYEQTCKSIYEYLTNVDDEIRLILIVAALAIGPQVLTYFLSGLSGSASAPKFVSQVAKLANWSFIKFMAGLGGILIAAPIAKLTVGKSVTFYDFLLGLRVSTFAFAYATAYILCSNEVPNFFKRHAESNRGPFGVLVMIHKFFTRNARRDPSQGSD